MSPAQCHRKPNGFTIIELLVVIVVIAILTAIAFVSYTGIKQRAIVASLQTDLSNSAQQLKLYNTTYGVYPQSLDATSCPQAPNVDTRYCIKASSDNAYVCYAPSSTGFTLIEKNDKTYYLATDSSTPVVTTPPTPVTGSGGNTVNDSNGIRTHTFASSGAFTVNGCGILSVVISGSGGGGGGSIEWGGSTIGGTGSDTYIAPSTAPAVHYTANGGLGGGYDPCDTPPDGGSGSTNHPAGFTSVDGSGSIGGVGGITDYCHGGKGGRGGKLSATLSSYNGLSFAVTIGAGGAGGQGNDNHGGNGGMGSVGSPGVVTISYPYTP